MTSQGLRGATLASLRSNLENEAGLVGGRPLKASAMEMAKGRVTRTTRAAMTDVGNKAKLPGQVLNNKGLKKEAVKPARGLTKQKATSSLAQLPEVTTRVTRRSAELKQQELMDQDVSLKIDDVEMLEVDEVVSNAFSTRELVPVDNIDKDDVENPQLVVEYVNEIYAYLRQLEGIQDVKEDYLKRAVGTTILPKMRAVLVDWLIQVHQQFNLLQETLYLTVAILDRYLQETASKIERKQLQLVGVAAMFIAAKYEEMYAPEIGDFVYITDRAYTESQIREMEMKILSSLNFELGRPLPLHFLRRNSKAGNVDAVVHTLAKYAMELTLVEYKMIHIRPSMVAAAALALSLKVLDQEDKTIRELWTPTLVHYTSYTLESIAGPIKMLASLMMATTKAPENAKLMAVRKKYEDKKMSKIARLAELTGETMEALATGDF